MIIGSLSRWDEEKARLPAVFARALQYFFDHQMMQAAPGHYEIEGKKLFVNIEDGLTKPVDERRFEMHAQYVDLQLLIDGAERQDFVTILPTQPAQEDRLQSNDIAFYPTPENVQTFCMQPGQYAVYYPGELHAPNLAVDQPVPHLKAIFKIHKDLLW